MCTGTGIHEKNRKMGMGFQFEQHRLGLWDLSWDLKKTVSWEMGLGPPPPPSHDPLRNNGDSLSSSIDGLRNRCAVSGSVACSSRSIKRELRRKWREKQSTRVVWSAVLLATSKGLLANIGAGSRELTEKARALSFVREFLVRLPYEKVGDALRLASEV